MILKMFNRSSNRRSSKGSKASKNSRSTVTTKSTRSKKRLQSKKDTFQSQASFNTINTTELESLELIQNHHLLDLDNTHDHEHKKVKVFTTPFGLTLRPLVKHTKKRYELIQTCLINNIDDDFIHALYMIEEFYNEQNKKKKILKGQQIINGYIISHPKIYDELELKPEFKAECQTILKQPNEILYEKLLMELKSKIYSYLSQNEMINMYVIMKGSEIRDFL